MARNRRGEMGMNREIKFRGKGLDNGEWVYFNAYGAYVGEDGSPIYPKRFIRDCGFKVDPSTVGQYTGLKDKNGMEIFEGDQLFASGNLSDELQYVGDVVWDELDARWEVHSFHGSFEYIPIDCVVNGNIHEHPNLLQEG